MQATMTRRRSENRKPEYQFQPVQPSPPPQDFTLMRGLEILKKRRRIVVAGLLLGLLAGGIYATRPAEYTAVGSLRIHPGSSSMYNVSAEKLLSGGDADDRIESEVTILQSKSLLLHVADELHLVQNEAFLHKRFDANATLEDPKVRSYVLKQMRSRVKIERVPKTEVLNITCTSASALTSAKVVNALSQSYIERLFQNSFDSTHRASQWLTGQLGDLKQAVDKDQEDLVTLQGRLGVVGFDDGHNLVTAQLETLAKANADASVQRIVAEARYRILENSDADLIEGGPALLSATGSSNAGAGSLLQSLRNTQAQLQSHYAELDAQFGPNYPDVKQVKAELKEAQAQVKQEETRVLSQAKVSYSAARQNENMTSAAFNQKKNDALEKSNDMVKYEIMLHEYQVNRTLYEGLTEKLREAGITAGLASNEVDIVDIADVPGTPSSLPHWESISGCALLGLLLAMVLSILIEGLDTSVGGVEELATLIGIPSLAVLPLLEAKPKPWGRRLPPITGNVTPVARHAVLEAPNSPFSEGIRSLRSALMMSRAERPPKVILFTSALPGEGKSTISGNLARLLAQYDSKVLLIDADLRIPTQHRAFWMPNVVGLSSVLTGAATLEEAIQPVDGVSNLSLLTSGPLTSAAGMLVSSEPMRSLLQECSKHFDFVLLDTPPCATLSDAVSLGQMSEAIILVVRQNLVKKAVIQRVVAKLQTSGTLLPGFVMNGITHNSEEYGAYYGGYQVYAEAGMRQPEYAPRGAS